MNIQTTEKLFSYGTLCYDSVQLGTFGRKLHGMADTIIGFKCSSVEITDPHVLATSGDVHHPILIHTGNEDDTVEGMVFDVPRSATLLRSRRPRSAPSGSRPASTARRR